MGRYYSIAKLLPFPVLNSNNGVALCNGLQAAVDTQRQLLAKDDLSLPSFLEYPLARMRTANETLKALLLPPLEDTQAAKSADQDEDQAWGLLHQFLDVTQNLPVSVNAYQPEAKAIFELLFQDGKMFLSLPFREEYVQAETRLKALVDQGYEEVIEAMGGASYLKYLKEVHAKYGEVLGMEDREAPSSTVKRGEALRDLRRAMKEYAFKVLAWPDVEVKGSQELCDALLEPLLTWEDTPSSSSGSKDEAAEGTSEALETPPETLEDTPEQDAQSTPQNTSQQATEQVSTD